MQNKPNNQQELKKKLAPAVKILMGVIFPVGLIYLLYKHIARRFKLNITSKTTFIYTIMYAIAFTVYCTYVLIVVCTAIFADRTLTEGFAVGLIVGSIIFGVLSLMLFVLLGVATSRRMLRPVRKMIEKIDEISAENLSERLDPVDTEDELMELTEQLNSMLDSIENSFEQQKYFVSDASHELRTPISIIHGYVELLRRWGKTDPAVLDEAIEAIYTESNNMKHIVEQLLFLAKIGSFSFSATEFNLAEVIYDIVSGYKMTSVQKFISVETGDDVPVSADRASVVELVRIIIDNAIKYTHEGGRIHVSCYKSGGGAMIEISDNGIGISESDLPHIFDRFYRCDKARGREKGSTGLGLAIAKSIIESMSGTITCKSELGVGTTFTIVLPPPED